ncbi:MAG: NAD(+)/NADH kinase, partial [Acidimicrobiales bacterium]
AGGVPVEERAVLAVTVNGEVTPAPGDDRSLDGDGEACPVGERWWVALNEMVLEKTVPGHMVSLSTAVDGEGFLEYKADGVLVATPTGSTAYNLSAGGPVLSPRLPAMVLTPVAPHLSIDRSLVLREDQVVTVRVLPGRPAVLVIDGREVGRLAPDGEVVCRVATELLRVVSPGGRGFAAPLRAALTHGRYHP